MLIDTRAIDFPLTAAIHGHVESQVQNALAPVAGRVMKVTARLEDLNADRGGIDKRCTLVAALRRRVVVTVQASSTDLYTAVTEAAGRLRRSALHALRRRTARDRKDPQRPGALVCI